MKFFHFDISVTNFGASGYFFRSISGPAHIQWTLPHPLQDWYSATIRRFRCILWSFISPPHEQYIYSLSLLIYRFSSSQPAIATRTLVQYRRISFGRLSLSRILLTAAARRLRSFSGVISVPCRGNSCTSIFLQANEQIYVMTSLLQILDAALFLVAAQIFDDIPCPISKVVSLDELERLNG